MTPALAPPARRPVAPPAALREAGLLALLFVLGLITRAPFVGAFLGSWDAVQYALGLVDFDVVRHQPHPPGSILYIALGRLVLAALGDANRALTAISVVSGAIAIVLCYVAGRAMFGRAVAGGATLLYLVSPLTWYYGVVALPYAVEGALVLGTVALLWWAAEERRPLGAGGAAVVLAVAGGVRQTTMLLLLPLWLLATWRATGMPAPAEVWHRRGEWRWLWRRSRGLLLGLALMGGLCLAWAVPLLILSGGPVAYITASRRLSSLVSGLTPVFVVGLPAVAWNVQYLWDVASLSLNLALVPCVVFFLPGVCWPWRPSRSQTWFLGLWAAPAMLVYVLFHTGQAGYLLLLWPLVCYGAATAALVAGAELSRRRLLWRWGAGPALLALLAAGSAGLFLFAPLSGTLPVGLTRRTVVESDRFWQGVTDLAGSFSPDEVVVLTGTQSAESFRQATYYLPSFHVYAVGFDR